MPLAGSAPVAVAVAVLEPALSQNQVPHLGWKLDVYISIVETEMKKAAHTTKYGYIPFYPNGYDNFSILL